MPTRQSALRRGTERGRTLVRELAREAETARIERGTSFAELGRALRMGGGQVARICRGQSPDLSIVRAAQILSALGMDLSARAYPSGPQIRDAAQVRLLERLRSRLGSGLRWRVEVPVVELPFAGSVDQRAWDAAIDGPGWTVRIDAETHVGDLQAVARRVFVKQRDGAADNVILLLADTRHHRELIGAVGAQLTAQFPVHARDALRAVRDGRSTGGNSLILL